jgi:hypothetical protein
MKPNARTGTRVVYECIPTSFQLSHKFYTVGESRAGMEELPLGEPCFAVVVVGRMPSR